MTTDNQCMLTEEDKNKLYERHHTAVTKGLYECEVLDLDRMIDAAIELQITKMRKAGWLISPPLPIEDAPRDGTEILMFDRIGGTGPIEDYFIGSYANEEDFQDCFVNVSSDYVDTAEVMARYKWFIHLPQPESEVK